MNPQVTYFELTPKNIFRITIALIIAITLSLFIHESGTKLLYFVKMTVNLVVLPFFLSLVLCYILDPVISRTELMGVDRLRSILLIFLFLTCVLAGLSYFGYPLVVAQVASLKQEVPRYINLLLEQFNLLENYLNAEVGFSESFKITATLNHFLESHRSDVFDWVFKFFRTTISLFLLVPLFTFFLLYDGGAVKRGLLNVTPNRYFESTLIILHHVNNSLGRFIRGQFIEASIIAVIAVIGLNLVGVKYYWLLGLFAGVCNLFPIFGPFVSMVVTFAFSLLDSGNMLSGFIAITPLLFGQVIDHVLLMPVLITKTASIHFMTGMMAILVGGVMGGAIGMVIAVPTVSILKLTFREIMRHWKLSIHGV